MVPLAEYVRVYDAYKEFMEMSVENYVTEFKAVKRPLEEYKSTIELHTRMQEEIETR